MQDAALNDAPAMGARGESKATKTKVLALVNAAAPDGVEEAVWAMIRDLAKLHIESPPTAAPTAAGPDDATEAKIARLEAFINGCRLSDVDPSNFCEDELMTKLRKSEDVRVHDGSKHLSSGDPAFAREVQFAVFRMVKAMRDQFLHQAGPKPPPEAMIRWIAEHLVASEHQVYIASEKLTVYTLAERAVERGTAVADHCPDADDCIVASAAATVQQFKKRAVKVLGDRHRWDLTATDVAGVEATDDILGPRSFADQVGIVVGPSGAGKTDFMLTAKPRETEQLLTFYMTAGDVETRIDSLLRNVPRLAKVLKPHLRNAVVTSATGTAGEFQSVIDIMDQAINTTPEARPDVNCATQARNISTFAAVATLVRETVDALLATSATKDWRWEGIGDGSKVRVRLALDEAGMHQGITRAVIALGEEIRSMVRAACKVTDRRVPIDVLVGGTGSGAPEHAHGSLAHARKYRVVDVHACFSRMFAQRFQLPERVRRILFGVPNPATTQSILAALNDLVSNARLGALIHLGLAKVTPWYHRLGHLGFPTTPLDDAIPESADALEAHVRGVALDAIQCFYRMNGLADLSRSELQRALADAMSIDLHGYDIIDDPVGSGRGMSRRDELVTRFGLLHDRAQLVKRSEVRPRHRVVCDVAGADEDDVSTAADVLRVPNDCRGRYVMQPSARELFMIECVRQLPRVHGGSDPEATERLVWQWGAALQLCVARGSTLRALLQHVCRGRVVLSATTSGVDPACVTEVPGRDKAFTGRALVTESLRDTGPRDGDPFSSAQHGSVCQGPRLPKGMHLVKAQRDFPTHVDCVGLCHTEKPCAMAVLNAPQAPAGDVGLYSSLPSPVGMPRVESVVIQVKLNLLTDVSQRGPAGLDTEFAKLCKRGTAEADISGMMTTRVFFVVGPPAIVDRAHLTLPTPPTADDCHMLVHIETTKSGDAAISPFDVHRSEDVDRWRFSPLYPLAVGRATTWGPLQPAGILRQWE